MTRGKEAFKEALAKNKNKKTCKPNLDDIK